MADPSSSFWETRVNGRMTDAFAMTVDLLTKSSRAKNAVFVRLQIAMRAHINAYRMST